MGANIFCPSRAPPAAPPAGSRLARGASIPPISIPYYGRSTRTVYLNRKGRPGYPPEPPARATTVRYRPGVLYFLPYSDRCQSVKADWLQTDPYVCHGGGGGDS